MRGLADSQAAAIEAEQEAGVVGQIAAEPLGKFAYYKRQKDGFEQLEVTVFRLDVEQELSTWREAHQRERRWVSLLDAAALVQEPGLVAILLHLAAQARLQRPSSQAARVLVQQRSEYRSLALTRRRSGSTGWP